MVYPRTSSAPLPTEDMPEDVRADYMEARSVFGSVQYLSQISPWQPRVWPAGG
jgi:hypothetical protein